MIEKIEQIEQSFSEVEDLIGYRFKNKRLLLQAFSRRSYSNEHYDWGNNEVLEFVGDTVLKNVLVQKLAQYNFYMSPLTHDTDTLWDLDQTEYRKKLKELEKAGWLCSEMNEGELSEAKIYMEKRETLAAATRTLGLEKYLLMGTGDQLGGVEEREKVQEDLLEALIGAIALDCDWDYKIITPVAERLLDPDGMIARAAWEHHSIDPREQFERWCRKKAITPIPTVKVRDREGDGSKRELRFSASISLQNCIGGCEDSHVDVLGMTAEIATERAYRKALKTLERYFMLQQRVLKAVGKVDCERAVSQLNELEQKKIIPKAIFEYEELDEKDGNGAPLWNCRCIVEGFFNDDRSISVAQCSSKSEGKREAAICAMLHLTTPVGVERFLNQYGRIIDCPSQSGKGEDRPDRTTQPYDNEMKKGETDNE